MSMPLPKVLNFCGVILFTTSLFCVAAPPEHAAARSFLKSPENNVTLVQHANGLARFIGADPGHPLPNATLLRRVEERANSFLNANRDLFVDPTTALELSSISVQENDDVGISHVRVQQRINGIAIYGAEAVVHITDAGVTAVSSSLISSPGDLVTVPSISSAVAHATAQAVVLKAYGPVSAQFSAPVLQIFDIGLLQGNSGKPVLTWYVEATGDLVRERIWINAHMGDVALNFSQLTDARNRRTFDAKNTTTIPTIPARIEAQAATGNADVDTAHDFAGDFYNYFFTEHGRDSFDGLGKTIDSVVRFCDNTGCPMHNAFWNGIRIALGTGYAIDDVVGHELTHAVVDYTSNLQYLNESGALNESYADIFGETIDLGNGKGNDAANVRWLIGEDLPGTTLGTGIRDMMNPAKFGDPPRVKDPLYYCLTGDNGGVHINSGVPNHAYALMSDGGIFNGYTVAGIGIIKAAKIQYRTMSRYLTNTSKFIDNYNFLIQSCSDLIGTSGITHDDCAQVKLALLAVEMSTPPCSSVNPPAQAPAAPAPVPTTLSQCPAGQSAQNIFADNFENANSGQWVATTISGANHWLGGTGTPAIYFAGKGVNGSFALQGGSIASSADSSAQMTNSYTLPANALLQFDSRYDFETGFDGGVIEYSIDTGSSWVDAGSLIKAGRNYDGGLVNGVSNPLGGRVAFTGHTGQFISSQLDLAGLAGRSVRFRFRMGTDKTLASPGWNVDNIALYSCVSSSPGVVVTPTAGLQTSEAGSTATFTIALGSPPTADVTINFSSSNTGEGRVTPLSATFSAANWNVTQTITVAGIDDSIDDGDVAYAVITSNAISTDNIYNNMPVPDVSATNIDNDATAISVTPASGLTTTEAGGTASYSVVLISQPTANVTLNLLSDNSGEGTVAPAMLTFTASNWNLPRTVTVSGVDDKVVDGNIAYHITTSISSADAKYSALTMPPVNVSNLDNDIAGITVMPTLGLTTTEAGGTASFSMRLDSQPAANVMIGLSSNKVSEGVVAPASLTFSSANWNIPQIVTVTGVDDTVADGNITYMIVTAAAVSADPNYSGRNAADVSVTNSDNDQANILVNNPTALVTNESGTVATFTLVLTSVPTGSVSIPIRSSNLNEGRVDPSQIIFTAANWNQPQLVTVTGVDDALLDGDIAYAIITDAAISNDIKYSGINPSDVAVLNRDNEVAKLNINSAENLVTTESGGVATFSVALSHQPNATVSVAMTSSNTNEGVVSPPTLTFTASNWNIPQTVTMTGVDDAIVDGDVSYKISIDPSASQDNNFRILQAQMFDVINRDNDIATGTQPGTTDGIIITANQGLVTTESGAQATFTIKLARQPTAQVSIKLRSSNLNEGMVSSSSLTFNTTNWNDPQTVFITGVDDNNRDGDVAYKVLIGAPSSMDPSFASTPPHEIQVVNRDNEEKVATGAFGPLFIFLLYAIGMVLRHRLR